MGDGLKVAGFCPYGCGETLIVGHGGHITCSHLGCERPEAVNEILETRETEHTVVIREDGFSLMHPLRERCEDELFCCSVHKKLTQLESAPMKPGKYRVFDHPNDDPLTFQEIT